MLVGMRLLHLQPMTTTPTDAAAFEAYATELAAQLAPVALAIMVACTLAWWPLDAWVLRAETERAAFAQLRMTMVGVEVAGLASFALAPVRRHARLAGVVIYTALLAAVGLALGPLGSSGLTWLADAFIGIVPAALLPVALVPRIAATALLGASLVGTFFLSAPADTPLGAQVSFSIFAILFTIFLGEALLRVLRRAFFQQRALDQANSELAGLSASLAQRVAAQTRDLRSLAHHLDRALEAERRRIARDLHDDLGQLLTAIRYTHARLDARLPDRADEVDELLADLGGLIDGTSQSVRGFLTELRPRVLDDYGLPAAAEWLAERLRAATGVTCVLHVDPEFPGAHYLQAPDPPGNSPETGDEALDPEVALALFRVLQEAATNALKHGGAQRIELALRVAHAGLVAQVRDDGVGFDPTAATEGFGLLGLQERITAGGGALHIKSARGASTCIEAWVAHAPAKAEDTGHAT